ncbi:hypothetical protein [Bilophila wadsworthia]|uniref:hypothetical protein n=1 Tax=Bilophila wadsworthia TaxID=35833 RepID=UPI003F490AB1
MDEISSLAKSLMVLDDKLGFLYEMRFLSGLLPGFRHHRVVTDGKIALVENLAHLIIQDPEAVNEKLVPAPCCAAGATSAALPACRRWKSLWKRGPSSRPIWDCPRSRRPFSRKLPSNPRVVDRAPCAPVRRSRNFS